MRDAPEEGDGSRRSAVLASRLREEAAQLIALVARSDGEAWRRTPSPEEWSISKEAEHVADAAAYHQWIVRMTIRERVSSRRPAIERRQLTSDRSPSEVAALIRERTDEGERLVLSLTDRQLDLPTRPPRARGQRLAQTIEDVLIGHYEGHRSTIEAKLRALEG